MFLPTIAPGTRSYSRGGDQDCDVGHAERATESVDSSADLVEQGLPQVRRQRGVVAVRGQFV